MNPVPPSKDVIETLHNLFETSISTQALQGLMSAIYLIAMILPEICYKDKTSLSNKLNNEEIITGLKIRVASDKLPIGGENCCL
jgi:hypothetical protein